MNYTTIGEGIKTKLEAIDEIVEVFNYPAPATAFTKYPAANIRMMGHMNEIRSMGSNDTNYKFAIDLVYKSENAEDSETILRQVTDLIIDAIENDVTIGGACHRSRATTASVSFPTEPLPLHVVTIEIIATVNKIRR